MTSPALRQKIARARKDAPADVPLVMRCANVVLALREGEEAMRAAIEDLREHHGTMWSLTTAVQLLSGRRGEFASDCAPEAAQQRLFLSRMISKTVAAEQQLAAVNSPTDDELRKLKVLAAQVALQGNPHTQ